MQSGANFDDGAGDAGRSVARIDGENSIFGRREPARRETDLSPHYWEQCETESAKTLPRKAVRSMERVEVRKSKRKFPIKTLRAELMATQQFDCGRWKLRLERVPIDPDTKLRWAWTSIRPHKNFPCRRQSLWNKPTASACSCSRPLSVDAATNSSTWRR